MCMYMSMYMQVRVCTRDSLGFPSLIGSRLSNPVLSRKFLR